MKSAVALCHPLTTAERFTRAAKVAPMLGIPAHDVVMLAEYVLGFADTAPEGGD